MTRYYRPFATEDELGYSEWLREIGPMSFIDGNKLLPVVYDEISEKERRKEKSGFQATEL